jgi:pimeloyl-ACP methyl ester carboxylesterase
MRTHSDGTCDRRLRECLRRALASQFARFGIALAILTIVPSLCKAQTAQQPPTVGRPILFVHGWCSDASAWKSLRDSAISFARTQALAEYQDPTNYDLYYDPRDQRVKIWPSGTDLLTASAVTPSARFFSIRFADPIFLNNPLLFDPKDITQVSILNKADELSQVIATITQLTRVKDVIVVAHSMGGLNARAYMENLASPWSSPCVDSDLYHGCSKGEIRYTDDIERLVTIDTPHGGATISNFILGLDAPITPVIGCQLEDSLNRRELEDSSFLTSLLRLDATSLSANTTIASIQSYLNPGTFAQPDDGIVTKLQQSFGVSLQGVVTTSATHYDLDNQFPGLFGPWVGPPVDCIESLLLPLHQLECVGSQPQTQALVNGEISKSLASPAQTTSVIVQATLDGQPLLGPLNYEIHGPNGVLTGAEPSTFYNVPVGVYTVVYEGGGPSSNVQVLPATQLLGVDRAIGKNTWNLVFTLSFASIVPALPSATTGAASNVAGDGAILNGTVNPNGSAASAWLEWGTSSSLANFNSTPPQNIGSIAASQPFSFTISGLNSSTTYFYRAVASNAAGTERGSIVSFTTLPTLPKPILQSPGNGASGVTTAPILSWSPVVNATSYRLILATTPTALPTDATSSVCGIGCVLNVTPPSTIFAISNGSLVPGTTYYWEVHARSPSQFGDWSAISSFTVGTPISSDFSLQALPASQSALVSGSASYSISTATTTASPQSITLSATNLPPGVTASFNPLTITSGGSSIMTVSLGPGAAPGTYTLTVLATGSASSRTAQILLTVVSSSGGGASFTPSSLIFPDQTAGTNSQAQPVTITNTGSGQLTITAISLAAGSDYFISGVNGFPINVAPNGQFQFQVVFLPSTAGPRPGQVLVWDNAPNSPQDIPLSGNGLPASPTSATVQVNGTLNGIQLPNTPTFSYPFLYTLTGPSALSGGGAATFTAPAGTYTIAFAGFPSTLTLASVMPSATQTIAAGTVATFTLNFTAPNDFVAPFFATAIGGIPSQVVPSGTAATYSIGLPNPPPGNASSPITLQVLGLPPTTVASFNPQPANSGGASTLTVSIGPPATPAGAYTLTMVGTNSSGLSHQGSDSASLVVTAPPAVPLQFASQNSLGIQADAGSNSTSISASSADGRFLVFTSTATNLAANSTNGMQQVYLRDAQSGTTSVVSVDNGGTPADAGALSPSISADGRFVSFASAAGNLSPITAAGITAIYVRDLQLGQTERVDVTAAGLPANDLSIEPSISADGRFIAFVSTATNLVPGVISGRQQVFIRDRIAGTVLLVSVGLDGNEGSGLALSPSISADGRLVAFFSNSSNLVAANTGGITQVFVRDMESGQIFLASTANDGSPANGVIFANGSAPAISADGRYVAFTSNATNLVPGSIDFNGDVRVFCRDRQAQTTVLVDSDASGAPLAQGGIDPAISADGRFIAYKIYGQIMVRDMRSNQSAVISLAPDGRAANASTTSPNPPGISPGGTAVAFDSSATNLVVGDNNAASDVFLAQNPFIPPAHVIGVTLDAAQAGGGATRTGTITLSSPAPSSGVSVSLTSNNPAAIAPPLVLVPPGSTTGSFTLNTGIVSAETVLTIVASANGGSALAVLTLEPAPALDVAPSSSDFGNQPVGTTSSPVTFTLRNTGTAALSINSIGLSSGLVFKISTGTCAASLAAGSTCSISVTFNPTGPSPASDSVQINFGTLASTRSLSLFGNGAIPSASFASGVLDFGGELVQTSSLAVTILTNNGTAPLTGVSASIGGINPAEYAIASDSCSGAPLPVSSSCLVTISFSPATLGVRSASLTLSSNAPGNPPSVLLSGTGTDFSFGPATGGSTSATVAAGQPATYNLQLNSISGFAGFVSLICTGAPSLATCSVSPSQVNVTGAATRFAVTVTTTAPHTAQIAPVPSSGMPPYFAVWSVLSLPGFLLLYATTPRGRRQGRVARVTAALALGLLLVSCGGGGGATPITSSGTPAGTFTLTVTGQVNGATRSIPLTLVVQ